MKAVALRLRDRYLALSRRERALALGAVLLVIGGIGELLLVEPVLRQRTQLLRQVDAERDAREALQTRIAALQQPDPNLALKTQYAALQDQLRGTDREFDALQSGLVQPQHMGALLQSLLGEQRGLQLLGLRSLPVTSIGEGHLGIAKKAPAGAPPAAAASAGAGTGTDDAAWLYRHAVEIRVQGSYADMLAYLQALEQLPRRVHWGELEIDARRYPANVMTVTIYTVSLEKSWWVL